MSCQLRIKSISQPISDQGDKMNEMGKSIPEAGEGATK